MKNFKTNLIIILAFAVSIIPVGDLYAGFPSVYTFSDTDAQNGFSPNTQAIFYFFDLRDRETYIQLTYPNFLLGRDEDDDDDFSNINAIVHVQIFDVSNNCNENNFFDIYTPNDTHVYNMRDIQTNDGNPSGVVLPDNSYGIVVMTSFSSFPEGALGPGFPMGNMRIIDNNGYEYRTNGQVSILDNIFDTMPGIPEQFYSFNFNQRGGVGLSDVVGITIWPFPTGDLETIEWNANPILGTFSKFDIDIYDLNEVPFSCRDINFSCVNQDSTLLEELLAISSTSVASFEYGINNVIPHSKGGELLCPGNTVTEGTVILRSEPYPASEELNNLVSNIQSTANSSLPFFFGFAGLNNGNGRGSLDSFWIFNPCAQFGNCDFGGP